MKSTLMPLKLIPFPIIWWPDDVWGINSEWAEVKGPLWCHHVTDCDGTSTHLLTTSASICKWAAFSSFQFHCRNSIHSLFRRDFLTPALPNFPIGLEATNRLRRCRCRWPGVPISTPFKEEFQLELGLNFRISELMEKCKHNRFELFDPEMQLC